MYRFIIQGTVESRMYSLLQSKPTSCVRYQLLSVFSSPAAFSNAEFYSFIVVILFHVNLKNVLFHVNLKNVLFHVNLKNMAYIYGLRLFKSKVFQ